MLTKSEIVVLKKLITSAKRAYYNKDKNLVVSLSAFTGKLRDLVARGKLVKGSVVLGTESAQSRVEIDDARYDMLEKVLADLEPNAPELQTRIATKQQEVVLPFLMPSLDKKLHGAGTLEKWIAKNPGPYIIMDKLDGVSAEITYEGGAYTGLYKGGTATHGMDWSHALPHLTLPKAPRTAGGVRAELIMSKTEFEAKWSTKYKNARNLTSGIVNKTRGHHEAIGSIEPIVFDVLDQRMKPSAALAKAAQMGFRTVAHIKATTITEAKLLAYLRKREKADHMIDGLVIAVDKPFRLTEANPKTMVAFKAPSEGNYAETRITEIEWRPSRHGRLVPRFTIEPVKLAGVTVTHASAHNAKYVIDNKINVGSVVGVIRSGEVIPYIEKVIKASRTSSLPPKELGAYQWDKNKTHLLLADTGTNDTGRVKALAHFFAAGLGVEGLGAGIIQQLYEAGYTTAGQIIRLRPVDYVKLDGWQTKKAQNVYQGIQEKVLNADLIRVMAASGVFGALLGERKLRALYKAKPALFDLTQSYTPQRIRAEVQGVAGFKALTIAPFANNLGKFKAWVSKLPIKFRKEVAVKPTGSKFKDQVVVFTGVRSDAAEAEIVNQQGTVGSNVSAKTTILVAKDPNASSAKLDKARALGIKILSLAQLNKLLGM